MIPEKNIFQHISVSIVVICLCFLAFSLLFLYYMMQQNERESFAYLREVAQQNRMALEKQVLGDFQTLKGLAVCIGDAALFKSDQLTGILKKINDDNTFIRMGLADAKGAAHLLDINGTTHFGVDLSEKRFFQQALQGKNVLSYTTKDTMGDGYINYYAVPVRYQGTIVGILCAVNPSRIFARIVDAPVFNGRGFSNIVDSRGKFVIRSRHADMKTYMLGLDDMGTVSPEERAQVEQALRQGKNGFFTYTAEGEPHIAAVIPTDINDWYILSAVPLNVVKQRYNKTAIGTLAIIILALCIFLFFLHRLKHITAKNRAALERLAYTDPLIHCRNYQKFRLDAVEFLRDHREECVATWYCDIKKFKYFNDMFGYQAGDAVLRHLADQLNKDAETDALFCRVSADNFTGIRVYREKDELAAWFQQLSTSLADADIGVSSPLHLEMSMGIYCPEDVDEELGIDDMINRANMAQKSIKQLGGSHYAFFNSQLRERIHRETEMEALMESGLANGEFKLYLQPKINIQQGNRIVGAEVLTRWDCQGKGLLSPSEFIPLFEKNGFIAKLDRYMFEQLCRWLHGYLQTGRPTLNIAVNVSRLGLLHKDFIEYYAAIKKKYAIPDHILELELTESLILDDDNMFRETVIQLQENGFICSLDDFGAGYSSLNVLKTLPIDVLKLDILFFRESVDIRRAHTVIAHILAMAKELHIKTIAEGVETASQVDFLRKAGCDVVQGYVFSQPMPLADFKRFLKELCGASLIPAPDPVEPRNH